MPPWSRRRVVPVIEFRAGECWWCRARADSREHRYKRSDLVREHGRGEYRGDARLTRIRSDSREEARSSKSKVLKFKSSMCARCNNTRSQPFDSAYDEFIEHVWTNEGVVVADRRVDLDDLWGGRRRARGDDLLRYFVKHICCRIAEEAMPDVPTYAPRDLVTFLDGGSYPKSLSFEFTAEPVQLRLEEARDGHPLDARWLGVDDLFSYDLAAGAHTSAWRYGWLTFGWNLNLNLHRDRPLRSSRVPVRLVATQGSVAFEFAVAYGVLVTSSDDAPPRIADDVRGMVTTQFALAGLLDTQSALAGRVLDERRNTRDGVEEPIDSSAERRRAGQLVSAAAIWATGVFDPSTVDVTAPSIPSSAAGWHQLATQLQSDTPGGRYAGVATPVRRDGSPQAR